MYVFIVIESEHFQTQGLQLNNYLLQTSVRFNDRLLN